MNYKKDFPIFGERPELIYFDNAATSQKPHIMIEAVARFYSHSNSNIHRGPHFLSDEATTLFESARQSVASFINAPSTDEVIFTRGTTEAINLVASSFGERLKPGDTIILSELEHHSNLVPWLQLKQKKGINLKFIPFNESGHLEFTPALLDESVKLVSVTGMSNVFGSITNLEPIIDVAHSVGAVVLVDAAQLAVHEAIDVQALDVDFLVFSGHKLYGPTGIGILYGKRALLDSMPPFLGGGDMVNEVYLTHFTHKELPGKFEAGTPNVAGAIGLGASIDYLTTTGLEAIRKRETELYHALVKRLSGFPFVDIFGGENTDRKTGIVSFNLKGIHPHDVAEGLSRKNICIRAGQHCTQPLMDKCLIPATARISLAFYNTEEEIERCCEVLKEVYDYFS